MGDESAERDFHCIEPFDIDNGELDGLRPALVFVLGYEYAEVRAALLASDEEIHRPATHGENKERLQRLCIRHKRRVRFIKTVKTGEWYDMLIEEADHV